MGGRVWVFLFAAAWLAAFALSFIASDGDGSAGGLAWVDALLTWQAAAMAAAAAALLAALRHPAPRDVALGLAGFGPMAVMVIELLASVALVSFLATRDPSQRIERFLHPAVETGAWTGG
jgi:hypothetical protein